MLESLIVGAIVVGSGVWLFAWIGAASKGRRGCSCGCCKKKCDQ